MLEDENFISLEKDNELLDKLLKLDATELGIFISMLSYRYMKENEISKEQFFESLSNSINILEKNRK